MNSAFVGWKQIIHIRELMGLTGDEAKRALMSEIDSGQSSNVAAIV